MNLTKVITDCQKDLVKQGHKIEVDGVAGPETWGAIYAELHGHEVIEDLPINKVDARSEKNIATLHEKVRPYARALVEQAKAQGITIKITSGTRTAEEQDALYEIGRTRPNDDGEWKTVTNAKRWQSNHNYGIAFDHTMFTNDGKTPIYESPKYRDVGAIGKSLGLSWGESFGDLPHFALRPAWAEGLTESKMIAELKRRHEKGIDVFA